MKKGYIKSVLINRAGISEEIVNNMSNYELLDKWLIWQGIIGWTPDIIYAIEDIWDIKLEY